MTHPDPVQEQFSALDARLVHLEEFSQVAACMLTESLATLNLILDHLGVPVGYSETDPT